MSQLKALIAAMTPVLLPGVFVFVSLTNGNALAEDVVPRLSFQEAEGTTFIILEAEAQRLGLKGTFPCRQITLAVNTSLSAVGFIAKIATHLAAAGIAVNPVSGFHHDHLFVPAAKANQALNVLAELAASVAESA